MSSNKKIVKITEREKNAKKIFVKRFILNTINDWIVIILFSYMYIIDKRNICMKKGGYYLGVYGHFY